MFDGCSSPAKLHQVCLYKIFPSLSRQNHLLLPFQWQSIQSYVMSVLSSWNVRLTLEDEPMLFLCWIILFLNWFFVFPMYCIPQWLHSMQYTTFSSVHLMSWSILIISPVAWLLNEETFLECEHVTQLPHVRQRFREYATWQPCSNARLRYLSSHMMLKCFLIIPRMFGRRGSNLHENVSLGGRFSFTTHCSAKFRSIFFTRSNALSITLGL